MGRPARNKESRHVRLYHYLLKSPAWQELSANARAIYLEIAGRYAGTNNGRIPYSVREASASLKIGNASVIRAINELKELGFLAVGKPGAFSLKTRHATEWRLTEFRCDVTRTDATRDFMRWVLKKQNTVAVAELTVAVAEPNGCCSGTVRPKSHMTVAVAEPSERKSERDGSATATPISTRGDAETWKAVGSLARIVGAFASAPVGSAEASERAGQRAPTLLAAGFARDGGAP